LTSAGRELKLALALSPGSQRTLTFIRSCSWSPTALNEGVAAAEAGPCAGSVVCGSNDLAGRHVQIARRTDEALAIAAAGTAMQLTTRWVGDAPQRGRQTAEHDDDVSVGRRLFAHPRRFEADGRGNAGGVEIGECRVVRLMLGNVSAASWCGGGAQWTPRLGQT